MNENPTMVLDILEELKQESKAIRKAQIELADQISKKSEVKEIASSPSSIPPRIELSPETRKTIKEHQLLMISAISEMGDSISEKIATLEQLVNEKQKPLDIKNYSLFAIGQWAEALLLFLVCGLVVLSCFLFGMGADKLHEANGIDLRYRYLRMQGKATSKDFDRLDSIFVTHRSSKEIERIATKVADYERTVRRQAELLEQQERIKDEQVLLKRHLRK